MYDIFLFYKFEFKNYSIYSFLDFNRKHYYNGIPIVSYFKLCINIMVKYLILIL